MIPVATLALGRRAGSKGGTPLSELSAEGRPTGILVPGLVLEAQFRCGEEYLILTTEDVPYEEALHVVLLGPGFRILDRVDLGHPFAAGILTEVRPAATGEALRFAFFGGDLWELSVAGTPRRLRPHEAPTGVVGRLLRLLAPRRLALVRLR